MKKRLLLILSALVLMAIVVGLLAHFVFIRPVVTIQNKPIGANVSVAGSDVPPGIKAVTTSAHSPFTLTSLGPTVDISPGGKIQGGITLHFKLNKRVSSQEVLLAVRESASSGWTLVKPTVSQDGWYASVTTDHLSIWQPLWYDVKQAASDFREFFLNGLSGDLFTQAKPPTCDNQSQARADGYTIDSSAKATLFWCFGIEDGSRVLKIVNHESYPLELVHPGLIVKHIDSWSLELDQLARIGSGKTSILYPFEEEDFTLNLPLGGKAGLATEFSGYAQSLYQLQVGVEALELVLSRAGIDKEGVAKLFTSESLQKTISVMEALLKIKDCANALGPPLDPKPDAGKLISGCFEPAEMVEALGWKGWLLAPIMAVGSLLEFFRSELTSLIDITFHRDNYEIIVTRFAPGTVTTYVIPDNSPNGITVGPDGNLWFTEESSGRIGRITPSGQVTEFPLPNPNCSPLEITAGSDGNLWFTELESDQIGRITPDGQITDFPLPKSNNEPLSITKGFDGNLWFTERTVDSNGLFSGSEIGSITPSGQVTEFPLTANYTGLSLIPITSGSDGNLWFTEDAVYSTGENSIMISGPKVGRITPAGKITEFPLSASISFLEGITAANGAVWITGQTSNGKGIILRMTI